MIPAGRHTHRERETERDAEGDDGAGDCISGSRRYGTHTYQSALVCAVARLVEELRNLIDRQIDRQLTCIHIISVSIVHSCVNNWRLLPDLSGLARARLSAEYDDVVLPNGLDDLLFHCADGKLHAGGLNEGIYAQTSHTQLAHTGYIHAIINMGARDTTENKQSRQREHEAAPVFPELSG